MTSADIKIQNREFRRLVYTMILGSRTFYSTSLPRFKHTMTFTFRKEIINFEIIQFEKNKQTIVKFRNGNYTLSNI